eukprot:scaffold5196_cov134-Pinguiococcus_pyrenoidosus.AAC.1
MLLQTGEKRRTAFKGMAERLIYYKTSKNNPFRRFYSINTKILVLKETPRYGHQHKITADSVLLIPQCYSPFKNEDIRQAKLRNI